MKFSPLPSALVAAGLALVLAAAAQAADSTTSTIRFSDPSKPGTLKIHVARGDLNITAGDTPEIFVRSEAQAVNQTRKDGLRVLSASSGFTLSEKDNVVTLDSMSDGSHGGADFTLTVPRDTHVIVQNSWGGSITCSGLVGDIEINSMHGQVRLDGHEGGAIVSTMNGAIHASVLKLHGSKPLSFNSMNGEVLLRVPADEKANVRLRTHNGSILTDFEERALVTKTESSARTGFTQRSTGALPPEAREAIREAVRAGAEIVREVAEVAREAAQAAREGAETSRPGVAPRAPRPPTPPTPPIPPMTGGKLVTGTLNGGGPEINVATMNGDVTLRKLENK
jgi:hypothetical protein